MDKKKSKKRRTFTGSPFKSFHRVISMNTNKAVNCLVITTIGLLN